MPARAVATEMLRWNDLKPLCESPGPCITITLPTFHHGARALPYATQLKASARTAHEELLLKQTPLEELEALMDPIVELQEDPEMSVGGRGMVIFRSPTVFRRFYLLGPVGARTVVGRYFHLVPFLDPLRTDREFYILGLNQKHIRLLHYLDGDCEEVQLPAAVPKNVEEAGAFDSPDHMLRNRSAAGKSSGSMSGVVFGTGSEREKGNERLHHFFSLVDKGLSGTLKGKPLMLSGARYEVANYRRAAAYPHLSPGDLEGDLHTLSVQEIAHLAYQSARMQSASKAEEPLQQLREWGGTKRISRDIRQIVRAAEEGRIAKLFLAAGAEFGATLEALESESPEDLLNAAAVLSIRNGAEMFMLPAETMGPEAPIAALFRY
jgi:hypothetical protein